MVAVATARLRTLTETEAVDGFWGQTICSRTVFASRRRRKINKLPFFYLFLGTSGVFPPCF